MFLHCLNSTEERTHFPHCFLRGMICKSLHRSSQNSGITFTKRAIQLSEQNIYSKYFHSNFVYFEQTTLLAILLQYLPLHQQKLVLTQAHGHAFLRSHTLKQLSILLMKEGKEQQTSLHLILSSGSLGIPHKTAPEVVDSPTSPFQLSLPRTGPPNTYLDTPA